jgi:hypothetical protein
MGLSIFKQLSQLQIMTLALLVILTGVGLFFIYRWIVKDRYLKKVNRIVKKISSDYCKDISIDLGGEQYAFFDYLLLSRLGIVALEIKNFSGHIYGASAINEWSQIIGCKSYKFTNPFFDLQQKIDVLKQVVPEQEISGIILFTEQADFPKGRPDNVMQVNELIGFFGKASKADESTPNLRGWNQLKSHLT